MCHLRLTFPCFLLEGLSIDVNRMLKVFYYESATVYFSLLGLLLIALCNLVGCIYIKKYMSCWWIIPFCITKCLSLYLATFFALKSMVSNRSMAAPPFFWIPFVWSITFHPSTWAYVSLGVEMGPLEAAYSWVLFFNPSVTLCLQLMRSVHFHLGWLLI